MNAKTKKTILNIVMTMAIAVVAAAGLLIVGTLQGWFTGAKAEIPAAADPGQEVQTVEKPVEITAENKLGSVNITRGGIAYSLKNGNRLRGGDEIETLNGSHVDIKSGQSTISLDENCRVLVHIPETGDTVLELKNGGLFADVSEPVTLRLMDTDIPLENTVISASAPYGSGSVYSFENSASVGGTSVSSGKGASILSDGVDTFELAIQSLNEFDLEHISALSAKKELCFDADDVQKLNNEREAAAKQALDAAFLEEENERKIDEQREANRKNLVTVSGKPTGSNAASGGTASNSGSGGGSGDTAAEPAGPVCTITIRCDTILNNMGDLREGKNKYVPANGCILATSKLTFSEGETVFDVLKRACSLAGIQLEYSWTPMYNSYYVEGINNLYEFDCGNESGWMYKVNEWFPNYGCSSYTLKDGDTIVWCYTCKGLGADVGGKVG